MTGLGRLPGRSVGMHFVLVGRVLLGLIIAAQLVRVAYIGVGSGSVTEAAHAVLVLTLCVVGLSFLVLTSQVAQLLAEWRRTAPHDRGGRR
jgi:hypothetical protein